MGRTNGDGDDEDVVEVHEIDDSDDGEDGVEDDDDDDEDEEEEEVDNDERDYAEPESTGRITSTSRERMMLMRMMMGRLGRKSRQLGRMSILITKKRLRMRYTSFSL